MAYVDASGSDSSLNCAPDDPPTPPSSSDQKSDNTGTGTTSSVTTSMPDICTSGDANNKCHSGGELTPQSAHSSSTTATTGAGEKQIPGTE